MSWLLKLQIIRLRNLSKSLKKKKKKKKNDKQPAANHRVISRISTSSSADWGVFAKRDEGWPDRALEGTTSVRELLAIEAEVG
jgi:hypothetical protein